MRACRSWMSLRWCLVLALLSHPAWLAAQAPSPAPAPAPAPGRAMPDGRRALHVDMALGNQRLRMDDCVGCPGGRADMSGQLVVAFPATRRLLVGASGTRVWPAYDQPSVRGRSARALVRWWPPGLGPMFVQASVGRMRYSFTDQVEESFQSGRLVILRGTEVGGGAGAIVPLFRATVAMTPFVHAWRVPDARGTRRTQAGVDVRHETTMTGWQAGLALTLRL